MDVINMDDGVVLRIIATTTNLNPKWLNGRRFHPARKQNGVPPGL